MTESVLLATGGAISAIGGAYLLLTAGVAMSTPIGSVLPYGPAARGLTLIGFGRFGFDATALVVAIVAAAGATMLFGLVPAWRAAGRDLAATIKVGAAASASAPTRRIPGRTLLIVGEMALALALALALLTAGGLMLKSVLMRGRVFIDYDRTEQPKVVVVNEMAARAFWPGEDPVGRREVGRRAGAGPSGARLWRTDVDATCRSTSR